MAANTNNSSSTPTYAYGGCDCRRVRYRMRLPPLVVHCCHCTWCQRETGATYLYAAMIENNRVDIIADSQQPASSNQDKDIPLADGLARDRAQAHGQIECTPTPSSSCAQPSLGGDGQTFVRCKTCLVTLWSYYGKPLIKSVKVGTLDHPLSPELQDVFTPQAHIFTTTKLPWLIIPGEGGDADDRAAGMDGLEMSAAGKKKRWPSLWKELYPQEKVMLPDNYQRMKAWMKECGKS